MGSTCVLPILRILERKTGMEEQSRIGAIVELARPSRCIADIGCDHGYIGLALLKKRVCRQVLECDISAESLQKARENFQARGMCENAEFLVCDGLEFSQQAQGAVIAGMGAQSVVGILRRGWEKAGQMRFFVLQPATDVEILRKYLIENQFRILRERIVQEDGRFYPILLVRPGMEPQPYRQEEFLLGRAELHIDREKLKEYIAWKIRVVGKVLSMPAQTKKAQAARRCAEETLAQYWNYRRRLEEEG